MGDASDVWDGVVLYQETAHYFDKPIATLHHVKSKENIMCSRKSDIFQVGSWIT